MAGKCGERDKRNKRAWTQYELCVYKTKYAIKRNGKYTLRKTQRMNAYNNEILIKSNTN